MDKVQHFELPFDEQARAQTFYEKVFGWKISGVPNMPYWMAHTVEVDEKFMPKESGAINGGMYQRGEGGSSQHPVIVITVANIDQSIAQIKEAGGEIVMEKRQVGDMGHYAQFKDTEGNILGVWESLKKE